MPTTLTQDQNLLFQSYFTVSLLAELKSNKFLDSDYYNSMTFGAPWIKDEIGNAGTPFIFLYLSLKHY
jgi:hypothetical protein